MSRNGKFALVTGSSRGIGRGIALKLATEGVSVGIHYSTNKESAQDTLAGVRRAGSDGFLLQADVTQVEQVRGLFDRIRRRTCASTLTRSPPAPPCWRLAC